jgi:hypothetical protein
MDTCTMIVYDNTHIFLLCWFNLKIIVIIMYPSDLLKLGLRNFRAQLLDQNLINLQYKEYIVFIIKSNEQQRGMITPTIHVFARWSAWFLQVENNGKTQTWSLCVIYYNLSDIFLSVGDHHWTGLMLQDENMYGNTDTIDGRSAWMLQDQNNGNAQT